MDRFGRFWYICCASQLITLWDYCATRQYHSNIHGSKNYSYKMAARYILPAMAKEVCYFLSSARTLILFLLENTLEFCGEISGTSGCGSAHGGLVMGGSRLRWLELKGRGHQAGKDWNMTSITWLSWWKFLQEVVLVILGLTPSVLLQVDPPLRFFLLLSIP